MNRSRMRQETSEYAYPKERLSSWKVSDLNLMACVYKKRSRRLLERGRPPLRAKAVSLAQFLSALAGKARRRSWVKRLHGRAICWP
jgi:hypothetical protein